MTVISTNTIATLGLLSAGTLFGPQLTAASAHWIQARMSVQQVHVADWCGTLLYLVASVVLWATFIHCPYVTAFGLSPAFSMVLYVCGRVGTLL